MTRSRSIWCGLTSTNFAVHVNDSKKIVQATSKFQNLLKIGMLVWGEADSETSPKTIRQWKDPSWRTSFKLKENSEDIFSFGSALEDFISVVFVPDRNIDELVCSANHAEIANIDI
ncbi:hypothetical protein Tco_0044427 [Tanacetum coccineum]